MRLRALPVAIHEIAVWANKNPQLTAPILAKYTKIDVGVIGRMHRGQFAERFEPGYVQPVIDAAAKYGVIAAGSRLPRSSKAVSNGGRIDPEAGVPSEFLVDNRVYTDPSVFELEQERLFLRVWKLRLPRE